MGRTQQVKQGRERHRIFNKSIIKSCTIELNFNKTIEFMSTKLNLTINESMMICVYYGEQVSRSTKKESEMNLIKYQHT